MKDNLISFPVNLFVLIKRCNTPRDLIALISKYDTEAGVHVSDLFDKAFEAGLKRHGEVEQVKGFIRKSNRAEE